MTDKGNKNVTDDTQESQYDEYDDHPGAKPERFPSSSTVGVPPKSKQLKVEMQTLYLDSDTESIVLEALRKLRGPNFTLRDQSSFRDKGAALSRQYWMDRGQLRVQGGIDYSAIPRQKQDAQTIANVFALGRLEGYGFEKNHCVEALEISKGDVGLALELLLSQYFQMPVTFSSDVALPSSATGKTELDSDPLSPEDAEYIATQRAEEKSSLESIYEGSFKERVVNRVWVLELQLDYLHRIYARKKQPSDEDENGVNSTHSSGSRRGKNSSTKLCSYFQKGSCRFQNKCRFSHDIPVPEKPSPETEEEKHLFQLEVRFQEGSRYPLEPALVCLSTTSTRFPTSASLRLSGKLCALSKEHAQFQAPYIYSLAQVLVDQSTEIVAMLADSYEFFLDPLMPLFPKQETFDTVIGDGGKGSAANDNGLMNGNGNQKTDRHSRDLAARLREDERISRRFVEKQKQSQYLKFLDGRKSLPAWSKKEEILSAVAKNQVVVISGETGCGKSTQVPQFLLDEWLTLRHKGSGRHHFEVICTQPRRLSAIGVAERVADERVEKIGNVVGYQIRLESKTSSSTRLLFCTTGILLRRLESDPNLDLVSHIIVDEVHERSEESDFLLLILRDLLPIRPDLRVILMSATMNAELFSQYFDKVPTVEIPGRTFPVEEFFLEDVIEVTKYALEEDSQYARKTGKKRGMMDTEELDLHLAIADIATSAVVIANPATRDDHLTVQQLYHRYKDYSVTTCKSLYLLDYEKINYELIETILVWIAEGDHKYPRQGSILVFLPGMAEIMTLHDQLSEHPVLGSRAGKFLLVPLHSTLSSDEQALVFRKPKGGMRKIVLSTNIAETSVTIDDCVFVIDTGKMKENRFDSNKNMGSLDTVWVSRANARQRKGRAGRVMPGVCCYLYTHHRFQYHFDSQPVPELHRVPLEQLLLRILTMPVFAGIDVHKVLERTLEPPSIESIDSALKRLRDIGALDEDNDLTPLGKHLAALPVDVRIGKLMLYGAIFCCLDSALTMAACLSYKSPFVAPFALKEAADKKKREFAAAHSDQLTVLRAYKEWLKHCDKSRRAGQVFAQENFLSYKTLLTLADMKKQFLELLASIGFVPGDVRGVKRGYEIDKVTNVTGPQINVNCENWRLLAAILCAALYPNIVKVLTPEKVYIPSVMGAIPMENSANALKFKTKSDGYVFLHPSSVNYTVSRYPSPYLVYQEKVRTSRIYVRDCTMVPVMPLVLFSGCALHVELQQGNFILSLDDGWIKFLVERHQVGQLLSAMRDELVQLLVEKIKDPQLDLVTHERGKVIISTIVRLISKD